MRRFELERDTIFLTLAGSHAHGTSRPGSDFDLRGIVIAPLEQRLSYREAFEQWEGELSGGPGEQLRARLPVDAKVETTLFDIAKLVRLAVEANPNALEVLFADSRDWLYVTPAWNRLHAARRLFLSRRVEQTYVGYALAQLKRIQTHRSWLLHPPAKRPTRADFGLAERATLGHDDRNRIEQAIAEKLRSWGIGELELSKPTRIALSERLAELWQEALATRGDPELLAEEQRRVAASSLGIPADVFRALDQERKYRAALKHYDSYERWKRERNPARAELEARFGFDTKHAMHLLRLMRSGLELLESGELVVRRPDAAELIAIRRGERSYEDVVAEAERLRARIAEVAAQSPLPCEVDGDAIDALLFELMTQ